MSDIIVTAKVKKIADKGKLKGYATVTIGGFFVVKGIKIVDGGKGMFISMPNAKNKNGIYKDICYPITAELRENMTQIILKEYNNQ